MQFIKFPAIQNRYDSTVYKHTLYVENENERKMTRDKTIV